MNNLFLLVKLSENDKRILIACLLLFIIIFIIVGLLASIIKKICARYGRGIDNYIAEMLKYQILTKPRQVRRYTFRRESKLMFSKLIIPFGVFLGITIGFFIYKSAANVSWNHFFTRLKELGFNLKWPMEKFFGLKIANDWPVVVSGPKFYVNSFYIYIFAFATLIFFFMLLRRTMIFFSRLHRARKMSVKVFSNNLEEMRFESR